MFTTILLAAHPGSLAFVESIAKLFKTTFIPSAGVKNNQGGTVLFLKDLSAGEQVIRLTAPELSVIDFFTDTAGLAGSGEVSIRPVETRCKAA